MEDRDKAIIAAGEEAVERAKAASKQPRFQGNVESVFGALIRWLKLAEDLQIPAYSVNSRRRDTFLANYWLREPHWAGVIGQLVMLNAGRGWTLTGGRNQVYRYTRILHAAEGGQGWRPYVKKEVQSYYTSDLGALTEVGRDGRNGPLRALFHVDPTRCVLTGKSKEPLKYSPPRGRVQYWRADDFFRVAANPSPREDFRGLGFCATSMAFELVKMLYGVLMHDQEQVGARMPEGILMLEGISASQWEEALRVRKAKLDAELRRYFGGLFVFFSEGIDQLDFKLIGLSQLPANFDRKVFIDQVMYGYALVLGMDPSEFWPVQFGSLGRGRETEIQHRKAATKGALEFAISYQEQLQNELPDSIVFEFQERDAEGELLEAQVAQAWAEVAATLYQAGAAQMGVPLLGRQYALSLLADHQVIPPEWTEIEEEAIATDTEAERQKRLKARLLARPEVRRAAELFRDEPIVRYHWPSNREVVLWERGAQALKRRVWLVPKRRQEQDEGEEDEVLYTDPEGEFTITMADVERAIEEGGRRVDPEFAELLAAPTLAAEEEEEVAE